MDDVLKAALTAVRAKNNNKAQQLLAGIIQNDPRNVRAWLLLSYAVEQKERQIECLHRVLRISPDQPLAKKRLSQLPTPAKEPPIQRITHIQPFNPIPRSELAKYRLELIRDAEGANFHPSPETEQPIKIESSPDVIEILFEDIARLPIIANLDQDLWLGIQLATTRRWFSFAKDNNLNNIDNETACLSICVELIDKHQKLEALCLEHAIKMPKMEVWIGELLSVRNNVYQLKQSRMRRFIRRAEHQTDEDAGQHFLEVTGSVGELFCWLPTPFLVQIVDFIHEYDHFPLVNRMAKWLAATTTIQQLERQITRQDEKTKKMLVTGYFRYSLRVAQGYIGQGVDYADLAQESFLGLMRAAETFDYREQIRFGAYATTWVWQKVTRIIVNQAKTIRIPAHRQTKIQKFEQARDTFDNGLEPRTMNPAILFHADLLDKTDFKRLERVKKNGKRPSKAVHERYKKAVQTAQNFELIQTRSVSFGALFSQSDGFMENDAVVEIISDANITLPEMAVDEIVVRDIIDQKILTMLAPRERQILRLRHGLADGQEHTLKEIGDLFGLSRERIRQLEKESIARLKNLSIRGKTANLHNLLPDADTFSTINAQLPNYSTESKFALMDENAEEHLWLDTQLANLPRNSRKGSHKGKHGRTRKEQISSALYSLAAPSHFSDITEQVNEEITGEELDERRVYGILSQQDEIFIPFGKGVFSLIKWEKARRNQDIPILPYCTTPLPDPPDYENAFLESVLVGKEQLHSGITAVNFLHNMLQWAKADIEQQGWFLQSILSAYYLVGLIPYTFYLDDNDVILTCTLPDLGIQELRQYCLQTLTERLVAMPEFWWLLQKEQTARPSTLGDEFADIHPDGLDDVLHRLRMLTGLGAVQKLKYGRYRLTPIGAKCANMWGKQPELTIESTADLNSGNDFTALAPWEY